MARLMRIGIVILVTLQAATLMARPRPRVLNVDCDRRGSIQSALDAATGPITIEFRGTCYEALVIDADDVTLRGVIGAGAAVVSSGSTGIEIVGADRVTLENFRVTNTEGVGVRLRSANSVLLDRIDASGNRGSGVLSESSSLHLWNCTLNDNGVDGLGAWRLSSVMLIGTLEANRNGRSGMVFSGASLTNDYRYFQGAEVVENRWGVSAQYGANITLQTADAMLELRGNRDEGLSLYHDASFTGPVTIEGSSVGVWVTDSVYESFSTQVTGAEIAVLGDFNASVTIHDASLAGNDLGIWLNGAKLQLFDGRLTGNATDMQIDFGSHADLYRTAAATVSCDGSVNILRGVACSSSPARTTRPIATEQTAPRRMTRHAPLTMVD